MAMSLYIFKIHGEEEEIIPASLRPQSVSQSVSQSSEGAEAHGNALLAVPHDREDLLLRQVLEPQDLAQRSAAVQIGR